MRPTPAVFNLGANSSIYGDKLLTTSNPDENQDTAQPGTAMALRFTNGNEDSVVLCRGFSDQRPDLCKLIGRLAEIS